MSGYSGTGASNGVFSVSRWTDKSFPADRTRIGALNKPDVDYVNLGLLFPQNDTSEKIYILDQMVHAKKLNEPLYLHMHFLQDSALLPNFTCEYRFYNNGEAIHAFSTMSTDSGEAPPFTYSGTPIINLAQFPPIAPPSNEKVSAILDLIIYRNDNRITGDVLVKYIDYHYQTDATGSLEMFQK